MAKTNKEIQAEYAGRQRAMGRKGRKVWSTAEEYILIKDMLKKHREEGLKSG